MALTQGAGLNQEARQASGEPRNDDETEALMARPVGVATIAPERPATLPTVAVVDTPTLPLPTHQPRFYVGVVGAPDFTTVKFAGVKAPLLNAGLTLEYRLANRLRLTTGLLRSTKEYVARREDYDWSKAPQVVLTRSFTQVDGACTVLDVPLNLRYDFLARPQEQVFGSAGLSTFFMLHELYSYDYYDSYNQPSYWERPVVNENRHFFSIFNFSFGYERSFGTRWSVQAEPYVKVPLAGVGAGKVQLTSGGVFMGVKYGF
ncbi:MAG TPA: hypothetical protein VF629_18635 [Hymenobacter sp.]|uniref:hypothetical protein n=1 Tax=Hymenobacter sp. TaxID=1898978 RepID=UPI002EDBB0D0